MKLVPLHTIFAIEYGNQLDYNKFKLDPNGVNFVTRSRRNLGLTKKVQRIPDLQPYEPGLITVSLGGSYLLSSFVQPNEFYTAQNIKVLRPREEMCFNEKIYYCVCLQENRFKYSSHGREANRSLENILVPPRGLIPGFTHSLKFESVFDEILDIKKTSYPYDEKEVSEVPLTMLFNVTNGINVSGDFRNSTQLNSDYLPFLRPSKNQKSSFVEYVDSTKINSSHIFPKETLYVSTNGQGSHTYAYVSAFDFVPNSDVSILLPKRPMNIREKLYYALAISTNRPKFSYGRKPKGERLKSITLPSHPPKFVFDLELNLNKNN